MKIGVLGTGTVGITLGTKLVELGYQVKMGSRTPDNEKAAEWVKRAGEGASQGTFADAASFGEVLFNCTGGGVSIEALKLAGAQNLKGKTLVDVANTLDFSKGMPPTLTVLNTDSLGEQIQREFPEAKVVKTLNTVAAPIMVDPKLVQGDHDVFMSGDDPQAKGQVQRILREFGWRNVIDLGDISTARGTEMWLALWVRLMMGFQSPMFNVHIQRSLDAPDPATASRLRGQR
jgi:8-hydroxy-5-deazaflavin:NADPH oxidoreductase